MVFFQLFGLILVLVFFFRAEADMFECSDNGAVYSGQFLCESVCSGVCSVLTPATDGSSGSCDFNKHYGFVYYNNKTYALTKTVGFWSDFSGLAVVSDEVVNEILKGILSYYNVSKGWIGLYDPNKSNSFNYVDPSRFVWWNYSSVSYTNFASGEPNNYLPGEDFRVVTEPGEHWVYMSSSDGKWRDDGYHVSYGGDFAPRYNALVEWNGPLDCVNGEISPEDGQQDIINNTCNGDTPCYVCYTDSGFAQCDAGTSTFDYNGTTVNLNQYEGKIVVLATGSIDYCFDYQTSNLGCAKSGIEAIKSWIVFIGDDNKYYWLGNPDGSPICKGNLQLNTLQYTDNGSSLTISIPQGVRFVALSDVETLSGQCTGDNKYNLTITIQPAYLCPQNRVQCDATNETPLCPEGTLNPDRDMCQADANIDCPSGYTWDSSIDKCVKLPVCPEGGIFNPDRDRCEKSYTVVCPSGYSYDSSSNVCYKPVNCGIGTFNPNKDRCEYPVTKVCPSGFRLVNGRCEAPPQCPFGTTYSASLNLCVTSYTVSCPPGYIWTGSRCETTSIICPLGFKYNSFTNRCETDPSLVFQCSVKLEECYSFNGSGSCIPALGGCTVFIRSYYGDNVPFRFDQNCNITGTDGYYLASYPISPGTSYEKGDPVWCKIFGWYWKITNTSTFSTSCPSGSYNDGGVCVANPSCPQGGHFDGYRDVCWLNASKNCPDGTKLDGTLNMCIASAYCPNGSALDTYKDVCWLSYSTSCPYGWSYDSGNSICYRSVYCDFIYNPSADRCEAVVSKNCGTYTYLLAEDLCIKDISCPTDPNFSLNDTITYDTILNVCLSDAVHICPSGTTYIYTWNSTPINKCELIPICLNGVYNPQNDLCYLGDFTCPLGSQYQCITMSDGKNYCSDLFCGDAQYVNNYENMDTPQGANDKKADGQIDENGNCLGTIYIFNGQDKRCRKPGTQTAFSDCCKKDKISLLGLAEIGKCNSDEVVLVGLRNSEDGLSQCHYVGEYCAEKWFDVCVQKKKTYCCFGSVLARIIQEQGRQQLGIGWGEPKNPNCRGFTPKEFQNIDFSKMDFSEYESSVKKKAYQGIDVDSINSKFQQHISDIFDNIK